MLKRFAKDSFTLRAVMILLVLLLISLYISSGYLAKYASDNSRNEGAGVANFSFDINNSSTINLDLSSITGPGASQTYTFTVNSPASTEVARHYEVIVKTTNNLPLTLTLADQTETLDSTTDPVATGVSYELSTYGDVAVGTALSKTYTLTVAWPAAQNSTDYSKVVGTISIEVSGTQVD